MGLFGKSKAEREAEQKAEQKYEAELRQQAERESRETARCNELIKALEKVDRLNPKWEMKDSYRESIRRWIINTSEKTLLSVYTCIEFVITAKTKGGIVIELKHKQDEGQRVITANDIRNYKIERCEINIKQSGTDYTESFEIYHNWLSDNNGYLKEFSCLNKYIQHVFKPFFDAEMVEAIYRLDKQETIKTKFWNS